MFQQKGEIYINNILPAESVLQDIQSVSICGHVFSLKQSFTRSRDLPLGQLQKAADEL